MYVQDRDRVIVRATQRQIKQMISCAHLTWRMGNDRNYFALCLGEPHGGAVHDSDTFVEVDADVADLDPTTRSEVL